MTSKMADLVALGMADVLAEAVGRFGKPVSVTCAGSSISDAAAITGHLVLFPTGSAAGAILPSDAGLGEMFFISNASGQTQSVYPHSASGTLNGGSGGAAVTIANGKDWFVYRRTATDWRYVLIN